ncbi:MAG: ATP-binding cassette domain-containing protein [Alphaproteobacteria bacterium]|nr:ATP-binding cassette domain-containing protein [Alphaproteobacteria bacterium]
MNASVIAAHDLQHVFAMRTGLFARRPLYALDGVSLDLGRNETIALVGESGSGKTTLGRLLVGLQTPSRGQVTYRGQDLAALRGEAWRAFRRAAQVVFQDPAASLNPRRSVASAVATGLEGHLGLRGTALYTRVDELLENVGMPPAQYRDRLPHELSGGQRQRVAIARAIAVDPEVLIADEPVSALDVSVRAHILRLLQRLQHERGLACLLITHDLGVARAIADRVVVLYLGRIVEQGPAETLLDRPRHPYTRSLLDASPRPDPARAREPQAPRGEIPSAVNRPTGCHFHPRCPHAVDRCREETPNLRSFDDGRLAACHRAEEL